MSENSLNIILSNQKLFYILAALAIYSAFWIVYNFQDACFRSNWPSAENLSDKGWVPEHESLGCDMPYLDPLNKEVTTKYFEPTQCVKKEWVKCELFKCHVIDEVLINMDNVVCSYQDILYDSNQKLFFGSPEKVTGNDAYHLKSSDHVLVSCTANALHKLKNKAVSFPTVTSWTGHVFGFRPLDRTFHNDKSINVLIIVFKSLSHNGFLRMFPNSYKFIKADLQATILKKYNIAGNPGQSDIQSFLPPFTGKNTLNSLDGDVVEENSIYISKFRNDEGYRTALFKDNMTYDKIDWLRPLIDHSFLQDTNQSYWQNPGDSCVGNVPKIQYMLDLIKQFTLLTEKKFGLFFIPMNKYFILKSDELLLDLLRHFMLRRVHTNTLIIIMSDHGPRSGSIRNTYQGSVEEKLPFMAIRVPDVLVSQQSDIKKVLDENADVLTTPRDIYATLLDAMDIHQHSNLQSPEGPKMLSLLKPISSNRTCHEAGISAYWCACTKWQELNSTDPLYQRAAMALIDHINTVPWSYRNLYNRRKWRLATIEWIKKGPAQNMVYYSRGFFSNSPVTQSYTRIYNAKVVVEPGPVTFEAGLKYKIDEDKFIVNGEEILRLNN